MLDIHAKMLFLAARSEMTGQSATNAKTTAPATELVRLRALRETPVQHAR